MVGDLGTDAEGAAESSSSWRSQAGVLCSIPGIWGWSGEERSKFYMEHQDDFYRSRLKILGFH